jgi:putative tryptophan/tyrosine transport system substrate-binding protein
MRRRDVIAGLLVAAATGSARAQQAGKVYRMALVRSVATVAETSERSDNPFYQAMFAGLGRLGYVEGQNLVVERHSSGSQAERFAKLAGDVVASTPDLIFVSAGRLLLLAFKAATTTIPIFVATSEAVRSGVVPSLAKPGGNITGIIVDAGAEIWGKRLELLREAVPKLSRVGFLGTRLGWEQPALTPLREAALKVGIPLVSLLLDGLTDEAEYRHVFGAIAREGVEALIVSNEPESIANRRLIVELAAEAQVPAIYAYRMHTNLGGLIAYAVDQSELGRRAAGAIDQILRGAKAGNIPFYQASKFELIINLKTAKVLGLTIPPSLLARADEVIE